MDNRFKNTSEKTWSIINSKIESLSNDYYLHDAEGTILVDCQSINNNLTIKIEYSKYQFTYHEAEKFPAIIEYHKSMTGSYPVINKKNKHNVSFISYKKGLTLIISFVKDEEYEISFN